MIRLQTIDIKKVKNNKLDLIANARRTDFPNVTIRDYVRIDETVEMRPDIIAHFAYGDVNYVDVILKFNNIRNPFSLVRDMIIAIPDLDSFQNNTTDTTIAPIRNQSKKLLTNEDVQTRIANRTGNTIPTKKPTVQQSNFTKSEGIYRF